MDAASVVDDIHIGRILVEGGVLTDFALRECVEIQRRVIPAPGAQSPRLGEILVERGYVTSEQISDALKVQGVKILHCPTCRVSVNVRLHPDALALRCGRCQAPLEEPPGDEPLKATESFIMQLIHEPLPPEVERARRNAASRFGKYILMSELGRGGLGVVHKAWDSYLGEFVALKWPLENARTSGDKAQQKMILQSLIREARALMLLRHPNILRIYDIGTIDRKFYISMEYLEGRTLWDDLSLARSNRRISPLYDSPRKYLRYLRDVARAVHFAHTRPTPVIHCDLKPSNVFIEGTDRVVVFDFGLARRLRSLGAEGPEEISGTPCYMAPEQITGQLEEIDARTDVYTIGAILYELLTGSPPFSGSVVSTFRKAVRTAPTPPTTLLGVRQNPPPPLMLGLVRKLETLCLRCLEKDRAARPQSALELANALGAILQTEMSSLPPDRPRVSTERMIAHAAAFRPDLALEECGEALRSSTGPESAHLEGLQEEFTRISFVWTRLIGSLNLVRPQCPSLRLRVQILKEVEVLKGNAEGLFLLQGEAVVKVPWSEVTPEEVLRLAKLHLNPMTAADAFGLALYARGSGLPQEASALLDELKGTEYEETSRRYRG